MGPDGENCPPWRSRAHIWERRLMSQLVAAIKAQHKRLNAVVHHLVTLAVFGSVVAVFVTHAEPGPTSGAEDRPFGQVDQDTLDSFVEVVAYSPDGRRLASGTVGGGLWVKDLAT